MVRLLHFSDVENAFDHPERIARVAGLVRRRRDASTLVCGTGDVIAPGVLAMETDGRHALPFLEAVAPDFQTVGNHDFDLGVDALRGVIERAPGTWLVANLRDVAGEPFAADLGVEPLTTVRVDGKTLGFVGVTDPETVGVDGLTAGDPVDAVRAAVPELRSAGADAVVVLSHAGGTDDDIARIDGVDAVLGGHDHDVRAAAVAGTPVVHPGERGDLVAELRPDGDSVDATLHDVSEAPVATDVAEAYRELLADLGLTETVARADDPIGRTSADRFPETALGNLVADAYRHAADADVAVFHPLMLRSGPPLSGAVTVGELRSVAPFDSEVFAARLDGDDLLALFESFASPEALALDREVFGHVSGAALTWRRTVDDLQLASATVDGDRPRADESFTVAAPAFEFFSDLYRPLSPADRIGCFGHQQDALVEYVDRHGIGVDAGGRMTTTPDSVDGDFRSLGSE